MNLNMWVDDELLAFSGGLLVGRVSRGGNLPCVGQQARHDNLPTLSVRQTSNGQEMYLKFVHQQEMSGACYRIERFSVAVVDNK
mmetsp:Transcript_16906/g.26037  ORF Transcript_16906/g.26037 Transcript_16906/m.26037 type:complete len:84 (+) Transcript_16906:2-253(+)